jgi:hypothetical protein
VLTASEAGFPSHRLNTRLHWAPVWQTGRFGEAENSKVHFKDSIGSTGAFALFLHPFSDGCWDSNEHISVSARPAFSRPVCERTSDANVDYACLRIPNGPPPCCRDSCCVPPRPAGTLLRRARCRVRTCDLSPRRPLSFKGKIERRRRDVRDAGFEPATSCV